MGIRDELVISLVQEVLGPRGGLYETLPREQDPRYEYITGVLRPRHAKRNPAEEEPEISGIANIDDGRGLSSDEEEEEDQPLLITGVVSPALDPQSLPSSFGLSFVISSRGVPSFRVCATWARYLRDQMDNWKRKPKYYLSDPISLSTPVNSVYQAGDGVELHIRSTQLERNPNIHRVTVYLVNNTKVSGTFAQTEEHVFQPQIRVALGEDTELLPVDLGLEGDQEAADQDERVLDLLYRDHRAYARGHLCAAMWRDVDPERPHPSSISPKAAPFYWLDGELLPPEVRVHFSPAAVRTEFVPCYPVLSPDMDWPEDYPAPELSAEALANTWDPDALYKKLSPISSGYRKWIEQQKEQVPNLPKQLRNVAFENIKLCLEAADRIDAAIDLVKNDENVRLAFCFANKAMAKQAQWARPGSSLVWRPFQLAFLLLNIPALARPKREDRTVCDLIWFATGGGKTEAYLVVIAFLLAYRRLSEPSHAGEGVAVISRYTLRLLTIQQFRRALGLITACELLRVQGLNLPGAPVGWRPENCPRHESFLWGTSRFSIGLWVGGKVTPNNLLSIVFPDGQRFVFLAGAVDILKGAGSSEVFDPELRNRLRGRHVVAEGEPAQVLSCPCCRTILAIPNNGLPAGKHTLHFVFRCQELRRPSRKQLSNPRISIEGKPLVTQLHEQGYFTLSVTFRVGKERLLPEHIDAWWSETAAPSLGSAQLCAARPARPGYFVRFYTDRYGKQVPYDFDIFCPNPQCELNQVLWAEQVPVSLDPDPLSGLLSSANHGELPSVKDRQWQLVPEPFRAGKRVLASRIPIPAYTVDDQVYHRCPSLVIATVDKFARLAYEPKAAGLFGNVDHYHARWGYYRKGTPPSWGNNLPEGHKPHPPEENLRKAVPPFRPPDIILQDELHLIEGPLGSMVGIYETAVDELCSGIVDQTPVRPKYIASTATTRNADPQVRSLFAREVRLFPPAAITANQRFFADSCVGHPLDSGMPGRLYVGVCAPGKGAQTPLVRIWSCLLQKVHSLREQGVDLEKLDKYWTVVGYFNAIRELAGTDALYRQDIPQRIREIHARLGPGGPRRLDSAMELSSRVDSLDLPGRLEQLEKELPEAEDAVLATSMFGTGVDVSRLSLMIVSGQPKTTSAYIQATGRVGRAKDGAGLVVVFLRASRPRDLDHYEFFTGYHHALYRYVEPVTVYPFSPRARERALGPVGVAMLRQARKLRGVDVNQEWSVQQRVRGGIYSKAGRMAKHRYDQEVMILPKIVEERAAGQPEERRPAPDSVRREMANALDRWYAHAVAFGIDEDSFVYDEASVYRTPQRAVVLGDFQHKLKRLPCTFENAPNSLRDIEETTFFGGNRK